MSTNLGCCGDRDTTRLPIRSIGFPLHGISIDVDTSAIKPCECEIATPEKRGLVPEGGMPGQFYGVSNDGKTYEFSSLTSALRDFMAGVIVEWESETIPVLVDGLPLGLELDGSLADLAQYPRLDRLWCGAAKNYKLT